LGDLGREWDGWVCEIERGETECAEMVEVDSKVEEVGIMVEKWKAGGKARLGLPSWNRLTK